MLLFIMSWSDKMDTKTVKLFDANNNLVPNFDEEVENILISIHGENYFDVDEELVNTNLIPIPKEEEEIYKDKELDKTIEFVDSMIPVDAKKIKIVEKKDEKVTFKDFIPVLFFIIMFTIIVIAGYYFLNTANLMELIK